MHCYVLLQGIFLTQGSISLDPFHNLGISMAHYILDPCLSIFFKLICIGVYLLYNVLLVSAIQQSESAIHIHSVKNPPAKWETWGWSLSWEDPLEEGMTTHSSILAWRTPRTEEPGELQSTGPQRVRHDWAITLSPSGDPSVPARTETHWSRGRGLSQAGTDTIQERVAEQRK